MLGARGCLAAAASAARLSSSCPCVGEAAQSVWYLSCPLFNESEKIKYWWLLSACVKLWSVTKSKGLGVLGRALGTRLVQVRRETFSLPLTSFSHHEWLFAAPDPAGAVRARGAEAKTVIKV